MTPVELGSTADCGTPRRRPVSAQIRSAASTPPGAHTFEILLLMMTAAIEASASRERPTTTGAPGNAFLVKTAAKACDGLSSAIRVSVILAGFGASAGVKSNRADPTRNPAGSAECAASQARCDARSVNVNCVLGILQRTVAAAARSEENIFRPRLNLWWKRTATVL